MIRPVGPGRGGRRPEPRPGPAADANATELRQLWSANPDALATTIDEGLTYGLGGPEKAKAVFAAFNEVSCQVAQKHSGQCADLRPVLNGPDQDQPADPNTQQAMQQVADAIVALGLDEVD